jgi:aminopeptidase C
VAASVIWLPKELFLVVVTIKPASASSEKDRIIRATKTSMRVKPFDFVKDFKTTPPQKFDFTVKLCKTYTNTY